MAKYSFEMIPDVRIYWAKVLSPMPNFNKTGNEYSLQAFISKEEMLKLKKAKVNKEFKPVDDDPSLSEKYPECSGLYAVKLTMPEKNSKGEERKPEVTCDGKPMDEAIGNGSIADVTVLLYEGQGAASGKMIARLNKVNVKKLVEHKKPEAENLNPF